MTESPPPLLTVKEAAHRLGVHRNTLKRIIAKGRMPYYTVSDRGDIRVSVEDVDAWLREQRVEKEEPA